jgi:hypothetical protein
MESSLLFELWFYAFAHGPALDRLAALRRLCQPLEDGVRSSSWDVSRNVTRVRADGHLGAGWLERLVAVVLEDQNLLGLEDWPA